MAAEPNSDTRSYGRGAGILTVGIGITGLVTYGYFALASHNLSREDYGEISLLWSAVFITVSVLYRPVEQLLSRTIAARQARLHETGSALRTAAQIQAGLGLLFAVAALALRGPIEDELFGGDSTLYWVMVFTILAYAVSYYTRGLLAGNRRFGYYGLLVFFEATSRISFAIAVAVGIASGQTAVALGIAAAPVFSLLVVPWALRRGGGQVGRGGIVGAGPGASPEDAQREPPRRQTAEPEAPAASVSEGGAPGSVPPTETEFTLAHGSKFAAAVLAIMLCEQTFLNAGPLAIKAAEGAEGAALAGFVFNILLIARAPMQLYQAVSTSLLPHLTGLHSAEETGERAFHRAVGMTILVIGAFAALVAAVMAVAGPPLMELFFGAKFEYDRSELVIVAAGMGLYLSAATLNQAALARGHAGAAALCWLATAGAFVAWILVPAVDDPALRVVLGFSGAAAVLCALLYALYRWPVARPETA